MSRMGAWVAWHFSRRMVDMLHRSPNSSSAAGLSCWHDRQPEDLEELSYHSDRVTVTSAYGVK